MFSKEEFELLSDPIFFKQKANITSAIVSILGKTNEELETNKEVQQLIADFNLPHSRAKISKGENYLGSPWQILDYPRVFKQTNVFAFRTLVWWGNFYSCTLHLSGEYFNQLADLIFERFAILKNKHVFICVNDKQWEHHFETTNFRLLSEVWNNDALQKKIREQMFIKLSCKFPLTAIGDIENNALATFKLFLC